MPHTEEIGHGDCTDAGAAKSSFDGKRVALVYQWLPAVVRIRQDAPTESTGSSIAIASHRAMYRCAPVKSREQQVFSSIDVRLSQTKDACQLAGAADLA